MANDTHPMTADDLTRLRAVAEAATPGPWRHDRSAGLIRSDHRSDSLDWTGPVCHPVWTSDAEFIATFDPPTVAALIDRVERAERERDELRAAVEVKCAEWDELGLVDLHAGGAANELREACGLPEGADDGQ